MNHAVMRSILSRGTRPLIAAALLALSSFANLSAQVATGSIVGTIVDASSQIVPGAQVTVREINRNTTTSLVTDASGVYTAPFLVPGTYEVSVELQGFKTWIRRGIVLQVNDRLRIDATLEVGTLTEATTVVADAPLVRTDSSEVGTVIEEKAVKELPLNGRNFAALVYLAPGITPGQAGENLSGASTFNPRGASNFNALGSQANSNAWLVDGIDNNEFTFNTVIVVPSVEQVREFKVLSGVFPAEFGRGAGVVSVSTKSGTNTLHGTGFEFLRNDAFDARNFFVRKVVEADGSLTKDPVPPLNRHQFGGALGGALVIPGVYDGHSRTFFFADYAGIRERRGVTTVNTVPTAATRVGDFSNYRDRNGNLIPIYDPLTTRLDAQGRVVRDQFPNNVIPQNRLHSVGSNIASIYPLPNNGTSNFDNYISTPDREITDHAVSGRVDHRMSDRDSFFVRFNYGKFRLDAPQGQANCCLPTPADAAARFDLGPFVAGIQNTKLTTHGAAFNYSSVLKPSLVNELRVGYANTAPFTTQSDYGHQAAESLGIRGINVNDITTGLPNINITNFTGISGGPAFLPVNPSQFHYQIEDVLVWLNGRHQWKFGYRLVDRRPSPLTHDNTRSAITFGTSFVNNPQTNSGGTGLAAVLLGYFNSASRGFLLNVPKFRVIEQSAFVQDDFKIGNRLTVNAGLRYEIFHPPTENDNRLANFDYQNFRMVYAGEDGTSRTANKKTQYRQPRAAPRHHLQADRQRLDHPAHRLRHHLLPEPVRRRQHQPHQRAVRDLTERVARDQPARLLTRPDDRRSVPADRAGAAAHDRGADRREPPRLGPQLRERNRVCRAVAPRHRSAAVRVDTPRAGVRRQRLEAPGPLLQPERGSAGPGQPGLTPPPAGDRQREQHAAVRPAQPVHVPRRHAEAAEAVQQRRAVPGQLHLRQVARLRQLGGERRRRGGQRADDHEHGRVARSVGLRHAASRGDQLRVRAAVRHRPALDVGAGRPAAGHRRRLAAVGHHDADDRSPLQRVAADRRQQQRAELAESHRLRQARRPDRRSLVQPRRLRRAAAEHLRRRRTRDPVRTGPRELRRVAGEAVRGGGGIERRVPLGRVQRLQSSRLRLPEQRDRQSERRPHLHDDCRQPQHAVRAEGDLLTLRG